MLEEPDLAVLARVIDRGSFARAAEDLGVPPSTLSRRVASLEERLGVRALERTTRHVRATEIGQLLAERGRRVRTELEEAERVVADHLQTPRGVLRVAFPTPAAEFLGPPLADMFSRYPELRVELVANDRPIELVADGFDAALHVGSLDGLTSYGAIRLAQIAPVLAASERYLERVPPLRHPRDLTNPVYTVIATSRRAKWTFVHGKGGNRVTLTPASPRALVSSKAIGAELVLAGIGLGIVHRTSALAHPALRILEPGGYRPISGPLSFITPNPRTAAPKTRAFADAMRAYVASRPDLFT